MFVSHFKFEMKVEMKFEMKIEMKVSEDSADVAATVKLRSIKAKCLCLQCLLV